VRPARSRVLGAAAVLLLAAACGRSDDATVSTGRGAGNPVVRWRVESGGADGMLATDDVLFVVSPELVEAFDTATSALLWRSQMSDTSGTTPVALIDEVLVVAPQFEDVQAFDTRTGAHVTYSGRVPIEPYADFQLPEGYAYADPVLTFDGRSIWRDGSESAPQVGRLNELTIVNDFDTGLSVISDDSKVLFHSDPGEPFFDESAVLVDESNGAAFTATADGILWAIETPQD
jgi:hypothetical protein